jgi:type II secretory pathway component GspD/PulD (secretin)
MSLRKMEIVGNRDKTYNGKGANRMKTKFYLALLLIMTSVFKLEAQVANPQTGVVLQNQIDVKTPAPGALANTPVGNLNAFQKGQLFYNAVPQTPAIGTSLKIIDSKKDTDYLIKTYKLKTAGISDEVAQFLRTVITKEQGKVEVSENPKTKDVYILVTAPVYQFPYVEEAIAALDKEGTSYYEDGTKIGTYKAKNRLASDLNNLLTSALAGKGAISYADNTVNKIYYQDAPSYYDATMAYFKEFDVPPEQVRIEAQIVEIELNDDFNFGMQLDAWKEALPENVDLSFDFRKAENMAENGLAVGEWGKYAASSLNLQGIRPKAAANIINYMVRKGFGKVLSSPTVVALNGQQATIASLDTMSYQAYSSPTDKLSKQASVGVSLSITPTIASETITLAINAAVNSLVGWGNDSSPIINTRTTMANIVLKDGEIFTLSGLRKDTIAKSDDGVPVLRSIPLLGYAFRHEIDVKKSSEIVVILTPHKVTPENTTTEKDKNKVKDVQDEINLEKSGIDKFVDRVILNK